MRRPGKVDTYNLTPPQTDAAWHSTADPKGGIHMTLRVNEADPCAAWVRLNLATLLRRQLTPPANKSLIKSEVPA